MALLAIDEAEDIDEFIALKIKAKINEFLKENKDQKIPADLLNEAVRWRLGQNDCQNRGYVLDGYPFCYTTAQGVFYITPAAPEKKEVQVDVEGNPVEDEKAEDVDPEELAK
jgi:adenylate kinase family enzyme